MSSSAARCSGSVICVLGAIITVLPQLVRAAGWEALPSVGARAGYDDNLRLQQGEEDDAYEYTATAAVALRRVTEVSEIGGSLRGDFIDQSSTADDEARDNQYVDFGGRYEFDELSTVGLDISYVRDHLDQVQRVLSAEAVDPGAPPDGGGESDVDTDVGLVDELYRRETISLSPYLQRGLTEKSAVRLSYGYLDQSFSDSGVEAGLTEFELQQPSIQFIHNLDPTSRFDVALTAGYYEATNRGNESDSYAATVGYTRSLGETTSFSITGGGRYVESSGPDGDKTENYGGLLRLQGTKRFQTGSVSAKVERRLSPSASGAVNESDILSLRMRTRLSERLSLVATSQFFSNEPTDDDAGNSTQRAGDARDEFHVEPGLRYELSETWAAELSYRYRRQERDSGSADGSDADDGEADAHGVFLSISYTPLSEFKNQ